MTPSEIEPATFWLEVQCLNQLRHCVPPQQFTTYTLTNGMNEISITTM
jgi:hypothetical protein